MLRRGAPGTVRELPSSQVCPRLGQQAGRHIEDRPLGREFRHVVPDVLFAINIPQEAVTIPETVDGVRAVREMQTDWAGAVGLTNRHLGLKAGW